jgi:hypothetical protein
MWQRKVEIQKQDFREEFSDHWLRTQAHADDDWNQWWLQARGLI